MSDKKELNIDELNKVSGGSEGVDKQDGVGGSINQNDNLVKGNNDTFYGPAE